MAEGGLVRPKQHAWTIERQRKYNAPIETIAEIQYSARGDDPYKYRILNQCEYCGQQFFLSPYSIFNNGSSNENFRYRKGTGCTFCMDKRPRGWWKQFRTPDPHTNAKRMEKKILEETGTSFRCLNPEKATHTHKIKLTWECQICGHNTNTEFYGLVGSHQHGCAGCRGNVYTSKTLIEELKLRREDVSTVSSFLTFDVRTEWKCHLCNSQFIATPKQILSGKLCDHCGNSSESHEACEMKKYFSKKTGKQIHEIAERTDLLKNPDTGYPLRPDIYDESGQIPLWTEVHGSQHYKPVSFFGGEEGYKDLKRRDAMKEEYCRKNGVNYLAVSQEYCRRQRRKWEKIIDHGRNLSSSGVRFHCHVFDEESEKEFFNVC
jgi:DNA-directed RNA polymerase subunit RPC12/RpoP